MTGHTTSYLQTIYSSAPESPFVSASLILKRRIKCFGGRLKRLSFSHPINTNFRVLFTDMHRDVHTRSSGRYQDSMQSHLNADAQFSVSSSTGQSCKSHGKTDVTVSARTWNVRNDSKHLLIVSYTEFPVARFDWLLFAREILYVSPTRPQSHLALLPPPVPRAVGSYM